MYPDSLAKLLSFPQQFDQHILDCLIESLNKSISLYKRGNDYENVCKSTNNHNNIFLKNLSYM